MSKADTPKYILWLEEIGLEDLPSVGGKNASLGEMIQALKSSGVEIPTGFVITSHGYQNFIAHNKIQEKIAHLLEDLKLELRSLQQVGQMIRELILQGEIPKDLRIAIQAAYSELSHIYSTQEVDVAVRSSATAEDLPSASFAGQQESFLNISGSRELFQSCKRCFASLFTDRAISYRQKQGFDHLQISLCIGIQKMIHADQTGSGVVFSKDQDSEFPDIMVISAGWGLGETVVQGLINPDIILLYKPMLKQDNCWPILEKIRGHKEKKTIYSDSGQGTRLVETNQQEKLSYVLSDEEVLKLSLYALAIEDHFLEPMDIEWTKDEETNKLVILQARPLSSDKKPEQESINFYRVKGKAHRLLTGISIGEGVIRGRICILKEVKDIYEINNCPIIVSEMANTAWLPIMHQRGAKGLITDFGRRNSHAATLSRELGIPAVLGTIKATQDLRQGQEVTLMAIRGNLGRIYEGHLDYETRTLFPQNLPEIQSKIYISVDSSESALSWWKLPCSGIGLVNLDFILQRLIRIHPLALLHLDQIKRHSTRLNIQNLTKGYPSPAAYFRELLTTTLAKIAATRYPLPVVVKLNSLTSEKFAQLKAGEQFETDSLKQRRGVSRYLHEEYSYAFLLELEAVLQVHQEHCLDNLQFMIPYCKNPTQANELFNLMQRNKVLLNKDRLKVGLSCDLEANINQTPEFSALFDNVSVDVDLISKLTKQKINAKATEQMFYKLTQAWGHQEGKVGIRAQKEEEIQPMLLQALQAGINKFTVPPEELATLQEMLAKQEKALVK